MGIATHGPNSSGPSHNGSTRTGTATRWRPHAPSPRTNGSRGVASRAAVRRSPKLPLAILGALLIVGGAVVFALITLHTAAGEEVLTVNRPLPAGSVLTTSDLGTVRLSGASSLAPIPVGDAAIVVGRVVTVPVVANSLLSTADLGTSSSLTKGSEEVAIALRSGQYPPDLAPGATVDVVPVPSSSGLSSTSGIVLPTSPVKATVTAVSATPSGSSANAIVSLVVPSASANGVVALSAIGGASLAELPNRSGS